MLSDISLFIEISVNLGSSVSYLLVFFDRFVTINIVFVSCLFSTLRFAL